MKVRVIGLCLALVFTVSGCVTIYAGVAPKPSNDASNTPSELVDYSGENVRTCTDADVATEEYIADYVTTERLTPDSLPGVQFSFAETLRAFGNRNISPEFTEALFADAIRVESAANYIKSGERYKFCNKNYFGEY